MKYFLLIAGQGYYPEIGVGDWKKTFHTKEEAKAAVKKVLSRHSGWIIDDREYDWYKIVDLREWIGE
jgi:hypothetical protein